MGICLDTEQHNEEEETTGEQTRRESMWAGRATPPAATFPMQNSSHVKFEPPNVPVIFILGGPGSGKVTHCDNLMQERRGLVHINMTDLLQQYAIGNDMQDFGTLSSKTVTEVLMLEMKMAPTAKTYLVSGYPRSMRDVAEYSDKIQTISGVVLVSWRQRVLERQIEYGARLGHVVLSLARMELNNFYRSVMPVAEYFDQSGMLIAVNGERNPEEVYKDFRAGVLQILGSVEDQSTMNGVSGVGVGAGGIPGEIVGVEPAPVPGVQRPERVVAEVLNVAGNGDVERIVSPKGLMPVPGAHRVEKVAAKAPPVAPIANGVVHRVASPKPQVIRVRGATTKPAILWVVGGPGSNKEPLCQRCVSMRPGWTHVSLGQRLRALADTGGGPASDGALARSAVSNGELVPNELVLQLVRTAVADAVRGHGLLLDGYPRDVEQIELFQNEFRVSPRIVLLDSSKLQLGRGRRDGTVAAFRRRLEVFRELTLPMLQTLDEQHRLVVVDGDSNLPEVQEHFTRVVADEMEKAEQLAALPDPPDQPTTQTGMSSMQQFAHAMSRMGGGMANGAANGAMRNGVMHNGAVSNGAVTNGYIGMANNKVKPMMNNVSKIPTVSQLAHDDVKRLYEQGTEAMTLNTHM